MALDLKKKRRRSAFDKKALVLSVTVSVLELIPAKKRDCPIRVAKLPYKAAVSQIEITKKASKLNL